VEYCADNMTFRAWPRWQLIQTPGGQLQQDTLKGRGAVLIGMEVRCPEPRKLMQTIGGLPNPDLQTSLRLDGSGEVRVWVNSAPWGDYEVGPSSPTYVADIDLEAGSNFVLLLWRPVAAETSLTFCFENRGHNPETTFDFA
jgi:hypothetical protein